MPRNTTASDNNEFRLHDNLSDSDLVLYYRNPTTRERQAYQNMAIKRRRNKIDLNQAAARLRYGLLILTGFRDGDFVREVDGVPTAYSSDKGSDRYLATWKDEIEAGAADIAMLLGGFVFDSSAEAEVPEDDDDGPAAAGEGAEEN